MEEIPLFREDGSYFHSLKRGVARPAPGGIAFHGEAPPLAFLRHPDDKIFAQYNGKRWRAYLHRSLSSGVGPSGDLTVLLTLLPAD